MAILTPENVFRYWETAGVPDSGKHEPIKAEIIQLLNQLFGTSRGGWVVARTKAELLAVVPQAETDGGVVLNDPSPGNNGYYQRDAGVWIRERGFPDTLARLTVTGGTANAVVAAIGAGVDPAVIQAFIIRPTATNAGVVTLTVAGVTKPVKNVNGNQLAPGEWTSGRLILLTDEGSEYRLLSDPDADGAAASAATSATAASSSATSAAASAAAALATAAALFGNLFPTIALLQAATPAIDPTYVLLAGNTAAGDLGEVIGLKKVASNPSHLGKVQNGNGTWYELDRGAPINPYFFELSAHAGDHSLAFAAAADTLIAFGGGMIRYPFRATALDWNTAVLKTLPARSRSVIDFGEAKFNMGAALSIGGAYALTNFLTLQGGASADISADITAWFTNYVKVSNAASYGLRVGDRIYISDSVNTWASGDGRPCHFATVDYIDPVKNIINFYPGIAIPVTVSNATTGQISGTGLIATVHPNDADIDVFGGNFYGDRLPDGAVPSPVTPGQVAGGASPFGLLLLRGRGKVAGTNFYDLCTPLRFKEGSWRYENSENAGSYNGYGVKIDTRCHVMIDNVVITGSRHAVGIGGSHPDGATGFVTNSVIGGARQAFNSTTYPSEEYGAFDLHPSAIWGEAHNCDIRGGITHDNGHMKIIGGRLTTRQVEGIGLFPGQGASGGSFTMVDVDITFHPRTPINSEGGGAGSFGSSANLFRDGGFLGAGNNWRFVWKGGSVTFARGTTWPNPTDIACNVAHFVWTYFKVEGVRFLCEGTNIRRILFNARGDGGGVFSIENCIFDGAGVLIFNEPLLDDWRELILRGNQVINTDAVFAASALDIIGDDTATGVLQDILIEGNLIESIGLTALITMQSSPRRLVTVKNNKCIFAASSGALARGIRAQRNQVATGQHPRFNAVVRQNEVISTPGANTITAGIEILGLAVSGGLNVGFFSTGDNVVSTATTPVTTTGTATSLV